ncbi:hypothetical protein AMS68_003920 [Peltaster fructicola]|uniref:Glutamate carboxypeptidase n=1 Tax=Peltaster fructicola TaxID=286661 RepID=A0A6H0XUJ4_9PEZI|nr:hypothetical protein AMS68_003920 [Peltaster fructicola]
MPSERTPLLQNVPVAEHEERYPHGRIRRFCTIALVAIPALTLIIALVCLALGHDPGFYGGDTEVHGLPHASWPNTNGMSAERLKSILLDTPDAESARASSKYYTSGAHLAGKNLSQAEWTRDRWLDWGLQSAEVVAYETLLNYPQDHRLALLQDGKIKYEATLEEDILTQDATTGAEDRIPTFHGYSANGNVTAQYVFCNRGTYQDYAELLEAGIELKGKIALVKYGAVFRGLKVKRASELGMLGVIMYDDPGSDGEITEKNGYKTYPDGPARNPSSVQRGSVQYLSFAPGDPTTIGYPSKPGVPRQSTDGKIPDIPSLPISYADALPLLLALNGHGPNASSFSQYWQTGGLDYKNVSYNIGPSPPSLTINLYNSVEYVTTPMWDTIAIINGTVDDEVIVIGNHRDAWILGGAGDPNSGSASLNEVVRAFGEALKQGWKPLRTIVFASWDGEEYGLVGSTEWVEEYLPWLSASAVAYVNVDVATRGDIFGSNASPLLNKVIHSATAGVKSPNQTVSGQTVYDVWNKHIGTMGSGSDFTAFQDFAGIPSVDFGFGAGPHAPVYHYHSNYDSFHWMDKFGDPGFAYHIAMAQILALTIAQLGEEPIIPLNATDYAVGLARYLNDAKHKTQDSRLAELMKPLESAIARFHSATVVFEDSVAQLQREINVKATRKTYSLVKKTNDKYKLLERQFLYAPGLDGRYWFKHVVFAPGLWTGYAGATYPGLVEAIDANDTAAVSRWVGIIEQSVENAIVLLQK